MSGTITVPALGDTLPNIPLVDEAGTASRVMDDVGEHGAVVFFMRTSTCPVCHAHVRELQRMSDAGQLRGARAVVVTPGGAAEAAAVARRTTLSRVRIGRASPRCRTRPVPHHAAQRHLRRRRGRPGAARRASALPTGSFSKREILSALG